MKIDQLVQVIEIAKTGSLNKAAQNLFVSQPSLSLSLKQLESELGIQIFERGSKGMSLTAVGRQLVSVAEPLCNQLAMVPELFIKRKQPSGRLLSVSNAYLKFVISVYAEVVNTFAPSGLQSYYREANGGDVLEDVASQRSDIGVLFIVGDTKSFMLKLFMDVIKQGENQIQAVSVLMIVCRPCVFGAVVERAVHGVLGILHFDAGNPFVSGAAENQNLVLGVLPNHLDEPPPSVMHAIGPDGAVPIGVHANLNDSVFPPHLKKVLKTFAVLLKGVVWYMGEAFTCTLL